MRFRVKPGNSRSRFASSLLSATVFFCICSNTSLAQANISDFLKNNKKTAWDKTAAEFKKLNGPKKLYRWNSKQKHSLHYAANSRNGTISFLKWPLAEADFDFSSGKLDSMTLNLYNKSCVPNKNFAEDKNSFRKFVFKVCQEMNKMLKFSHGRVSVKLINSARCYSCTWNTPNGYAILKWSYDGANSYNFIAHYVTAYIYQDKKAFEQAGRSRVASLGDLDLKSRIQTNSKGDRYLEIPMVDQGKRGYCVVACAERILKYYNANVDQHVLAQAAGTSGSRGTRVNEIEDSMRSVGAKCKFRVDDITEFSPLVGNVKILSFIKKYNQYARRDNKKQINIRRVRSYNQLFHMMDEDVLVKTKIKFDSSGYRRFQSKTKDSIDDGIPVLWCVMLGMVKEPKIPQNMGGHMRLIIGYNPKTDEVIYTDSWGRGHGFKRISWGKAWAMTQMAHVFIPRKK